METAMRFSHLLGALAVGYYILFPFLAMRVEKLSAAAQEGYVSLLHVSNRIGQYILILQFITGGYLISQNHYSVAWIVIVIVVFFLLAALAGMMGKPMKRIMENVRSGKEIRSIIKKITTYSLIICVCFIALVVLMKFPSII